MNEIICNYISISQPIGDFYCVKMNAKDLFDISYSDIRKMEGVSEEGIDSYLGIQRELSQSRVKKIRDYISSVDATFPNSIIVAISDEFVSEVNNKLVISYDDSENGKIAKILDGQHRLAGFENGNFKFKDVDGIERDFELLVTIFIGADLHTQAQVFTMVNQNQTKVNKSLVYDLESLAIARSPFKTAHQIAVAVNGTDGSPFYRRIKRLGLKQNGIDSQILTQAAFVDNLVKLISRNPSLDRDVLLGKHKGFFGLISSNLPDLDTGSFNKHPFRKSFSDADDATIAVNLVSYYKEIERRWPNSWSWENKKSTLNKTVGLIASMRFLKDVMNFLVDNKGYSYGEVIPSSEFSSIIQRVNLDEDYFESMDSISKTAGVIYKAIKDSSEV